eukprot:Pompholyxophrys_punicea_v1_NODE_464_length_1898_cov_4.854042.p1 type:complete len:176 gc:universal NODE_464_length_1898_cov_4.854042:1230-703(-)
MCIYQVLANGIEGLHCQIRRRTNPGASAPKKHVWPISIITLSMTSRRIIMEDPLSHTPQIEFKNCTHWQPSLSLNSSMMFEKIWDYLGELSPQIATQKVFLLFANFGQHSSSESNATEGDRQITRARLITLVHPIGFFTPNRSATENCSAAEKIITLYLSLIWNTHRTGKRKRDS